jgi:hypothetical protein
MYPGKRQVLILYNQQGLSIKNKQLAELNKDQQGLSERDITIHIIETSNEKAEAKKWRVDDTKAFTFILIGKDGGEKLRSDTVVPYRKLFATIDAMPMRRTEMQHQ